MKTLHTISVILLPITVIGLILWRFFVMFPDWLVRLTGSLALVSAFTTMLSSLKLKKCNGCKESA